MITIKGTNKIKGALDLTGINLQLKRGDNLLISEAQFADHTVQTAVSMGFISFDRGEVFDPDAQPKMIICKNIYDRPLRINALNEDIRVGQSFKLTDVQLNSSDIRGALAKGMIEIVSSARSKNGTQVDVKVSDELNSDLDLNADLKESTILDTNEEASIPTVLDVDPAPITKKDIPDPKGKSVIWNPNKDPIAHTKTSMKAVTANQQGHDVLETNVELNDIEFVDKEEANRKRTEHPILKNKKEEPDDGLDFV